MKRLWKRIRDSGKVTIVDFIISVLAVIASIIMLVLNYNDIIHLRLNDLICIAIVLLGLIITSILIERYGILCSIYEGFSKPDENRAFMVIRNRYEHLYPIDDLISDITEMDVMAIANTTFLSGSGITHLVQAAKKGVKVKLLSIDPGSELAFFYEKSKILSPISIPLSGNVESYKRARNRNKKFQDNIEMKVCNTIIPYSLMILRKRGQIKTIKIDLYTNNVEYYDRRSIIIPSTDIENVDFFLKQWEYLWGQESNREIL